MTKLLTSHEREDLSYQLDLQDGLERIESEAGMEYFVPIGEVEKFISRIGRGDIFVGILSGANGIGKTWSEVNILGNITFGKQNHFFNYPLFNNWPYVRRGRIGSSPKNLEEIGAIDSGIKEWWPRGKFRAEKKSKSYNSLYTIRERGWIIDVMSYEQAVTEWESATLGVAILDEPPPKDIFNATVARMRMGGIILIFMTPMTNVGWIFDNLVGRREGLKGHQSIFLAIVDIEDACKTHGKNGFLEHYNIVQMIDLMDPEEREARAHGRPLHLAGRIYKTFSENIHIVDDFVIPSEWPRVQLTDPHDAYPFALSWVAVDTNDDLYFYDEYPTEPFEDINRTDLTYKDYATIIRNKEGRDRMAKRIMDPNFGRKRQGNTGMTVQEEMATFGLVYETEVDDSLINGHARVREYLKFDVTRAINEINKPKLHVLRKCRNHWFSMLNYGNKPQRNLERKDKLNLNQSFKDFPDLIRYACMSDLRYHLLITSDDASGRAEAIARNKRSRQATTKYGGWA